MSVYFSALRLASGFFSPFSVRRGVRGELPVRRVLSVLCVGVVMGVGGGSVHAQGRVESASAGRVMDAAGAVDSAVMVEDLPLAGGMYQRVWYAPAVGAQRGTIIMFPGGAGTVGIKKDGRFESGNNFLVRTRDAWRQRGYGIVIVDAIDHQSMRGKRSTPEYAAITRKVIEFAIRRAGKPIWVMGTSQGSIAAMAAASHALPGEISGVILTESVSVLGKSHETVFDALPGEVRVPSLVVANRDDGCNVAPPGNAKRIAESMDHSRSTVIYVQGGEQRSPVGCGSLSPHGYYGIEGEVIGRIVEWMGG